MVHDALPDLALKRAKTFWKKSDKMTQNGGSTLIFPQFYVKSGQSWPSTSSPCADTCAHGGDWPAKVLRKRKFHRQNPLELETPKPNVFLVKRPSDLGLD